MFGFYLRQKASHLRDRISIIIHRVCPKKICSVAEVHAVACISKTTNILLLKLKYLALFLRGLLQPLTVHARDLHQNEKELNNADCATLSQL